MPTPNSLALVRQSDGRVVTFVRADLPEGYAPPEGHTLVDPADLPSGWQHVEPPARTDAEQWADFLAGHLTVNGIDLKASISARDAFTGQAVMLREALDAGLVAATTEVSIWDAHEHEHKLTVAQCRALLLGYGLAWKDAFDRLAP